MAAKKKPMPFGKLNKKAQEGKPFTRKSTKKPTPKKGG